jgi:hypothetical protein
MMLGGGQVLGAAPGLDQVGDADCGGEQQEDKRGRRTQTQCVRVVPMAD